MFEFYPHKQTIILYGINYRRQHQSALLSKAFSLSMIVLTHIPQVFGPIGWNEEMEDFTWQVQSLELNLIENAWDVLCLICVYGGILYKIGC